MFRKTNILELKIDRACLHGNGEPDLALNLDICDYVNEKKGNSAHEAVFALLPYINGRSRSSALLALTLLDNLVKNCGHPVHLQVASKDFLNNFVRKFPEFEPAVPNAVQYRILELLQEWRYTLCKRSRIKEDLYRINDMCNLLQKKNWHFPEVDIEGASIVLGPQTTLKTTEEQEREEKEALQAKLQELLRRGTAADLREANRLVKIITGYEHGDGVARSQDFESERSRELGELSAATDRLLEALQSDTPAASVVYENKEQLSWCLARQSRVQTLIQGYVEAEDPPAELDRLLDLNDRIGRAASAFKAIEAGDPAPSAAPPPRAAPADDGAALISFDEPLMAAAPAPSTQALPAPATHQPPPKSVVDDLLLLQQPQINTLATPGFYQSRTEPPSYAPRNQAPNIPQRTTSADPDSLIDL